jgi:hypothetical protein
MNEYMNRALAAYFRSGGGAPPDQGRSGLQNLDGKQYMVLRDVQGGPLAVYRVRNDGVLKRLRRLPAGLI